MNFRKKEKGIGLVELLVALAIAGIVTAMSVAAFSNLRNTDLVESASQEVVSALNQAGKWTIEGLNNSVYGVHIDPSAVTIFTGSTYQNASNSNIVTPLPVGIFASATPADYFFQRIYGTTTSGTIQVYVSSNQSYVRTINVQPTGVSEEK